MTILIKQFSVVFLPDNIHPPIKFYKHMQPVILERILKTVKEISNSSVPEEA